MQIEQIVSNELHLGQQLNKSVENDRANFALLLALMSGDVEDQAQFHLQSNAATDVDCHSTSLRDQFEVPPLQTLVADPLGELQSLKCTQMINDRGLQDIRLSHCLNPEPLSFELGKKHGIDSDVVDNMGLSALRKFTSQPSQPLIEQLIPDSIIALQQNYSAQLVNH